MKYKGENFDKYDQKNDESNKNILDEKISENNIKKNSEEWNFVEFHLKSSLPFEIEIKKIKSIINVHIQINFEKKCKNKLNTYAWQQYNPQDELNTFEKIQNRGYHISSTGIDLSTGNINGDDNLDEMLFDTDLTYIMTKILIGKSLMKVMNMKTLNKIDEETSESLKSLGYDSLHIYNSDETKHNKQSAEFKTYNYRIFDSSNILPLYLVTFNYKQSIESSNKKKCMNCFENDVKFYCVEDVIFLCEECWVKCHDDNEYYSKMNHEKRNAILNNTGKCFYELHKDREAEYYCKTCNLPLCSFCKVLGTHSQADTLKHELVDIEVMYHESDDQYKNSKNEIYEMNQKVGKTIENIKKLNLTTDHDDTMKSINVEHAKNLESFKKESFKFLRPYISTIQELHILNEAVNYFENYYIKREEVNSLEPKNKAELVLVSSFKYNTIRDFIYNYDKMDLKCPNSEELEFKVEKMLNTFEIKNYKIRDYSDKYDKVKTVVDEKKKENKKTVNIEMLKILSGHFNPKNSFYNTSNLNATNMDGSQNLDNEVLITKKI